MKKIVPAVVLALAALHTHAQSDFALTFNIPGGLLIGPTNFTALALDVDKGTRFFAANGVLAAGSIYSPATGTCFATAGGGVFCNLQIDTTSFTLELDANLSGTITARSGTGTTIGTQAIVLTQAI